jgi:uncharacterized membrane protein YoaK (UPF0700 family)
MEKSAMPSAAADQRNVVQAHLPALFLMLLAGATDTLIFTHSKELLAVYMTGNSSKLGQSVAHGDWGTVLPLVAVIGSFVAATTLGAWLGKHAGRWREPLLMVILSLLLAIAWPTASEKFSVATVMLVAAAMGMLNQVLANEPGVSFITGTLVKLGRAVADGQRKDILIGVLRWIAFALGALAGALLEPQAKTLMLLLISSAAMAGALAMALSASLHHGSTLQP